MNAPPTPPAQGAVTAHPVETILGVPFHDGDMASALERALAARGLVVAPSGPNLAAIDRMPAYAAAICSADLVLTDSGLLLLLWRLLRGRTLPRVSGLGFLRALLAHPAFCVERTLWVAPDAAVAAATATWLESQGLPTGGYYTAPRYDPAAPQDTALLERVRRERPTCIILCIGGGIQEPLGHWVLDRLEHRPLILCTGAAIGFLNGAQANIPPWADRLCIGWLLRCLQSPRRFVPRYLAAVRLVALVLRWREKAPR